MCLPDGKRIEFHLIRRGKAAHIPLKVEGIFSEAHLHCADTVIAVARPETADKTVTARSLREAQFYGFHSTLDTGFTQKTYP